MTYRNIRLSLFQRFLYLLFRVIFYPAFAVFYRRRLVLHRENFRFDGPAIVVSNHPSTLADVLNVGLAIRQEMFFLANYGLFKSPAGNWFFSRLFCIPVKRKEDTAEGETRNNQMSFKQCYRHLRRNGVLFIAPEGVSWMNRFVREFKTGTARIAFGAMKDSKGPLDLKIIPVGLTYSAADQFRSEVVVNAGAPVAVGDWFDAWKKEPDETIDRLSAYLENQVKALTIHTRDEAGDLYTGYLETILQNTYPLPREAAFYRSQRLTQTCLDNQDLIALTARYFDRLAQNGLTDEGLSAAVSKDAKVRTMGDGLRLALGFPFFLMGYALWFLPCYLPWLLNKKLNLYVGYSSTVKILSGLIVFPLFFWALNRLVDGSTGDRAMGWWAMGFTVLLGLLTERYLDIRKRFSAQQKAGFRRKRNPEIFGELVNLRDRILSNCQFEAETGNNDRV